jgi:hypothetical protein
VFTFFPVFVNVNEIPDVTARCAEDIDYIFLLQSCLFQGIDTARRIEKQFLTVMDVPPKLRAFICVAASPDCDRYACTASLTLSSAERLTLLLCLQCFSSKALLVIDSRFVSPSDLARA